MSLRGWDLLLQQPLGGSPLFYCELTLAIKNGTDGITDIHSVHTRGYLLSTQIVVGEQPGYRSSSKDPCPSSSEIGTWGAISPPGYPL